MIKLNKIIQSVIRHALSGTGVGLLLTGTLGPEETSILVNNSTDLIIGGLSYALAQGWSLYNALKK